MIPTVGAEFVCRMEDVLDLYAEPHDPARPVVCFDETSKQLVAETRTPLPMEPGKPERVRYKYARNEQRAIISWQFTADDARRKLHRLYPS